MEPVLSRVCGIDEAGRGPLAGPVTACAVILSDNFPTHILRDSKAMSPPARIRVASVIRREAIDYGVGWSWPEEIDHLNIHRATLLAMKRALCALSVTPELVLVDGCFAPLTPCPSRCVIGGDRTVPQIQAASIIAKTMRDLWMQRYSRIEPVYGFNRHKGYPTREHRDSIRAIGVSAIHRRSFRLLESSDPPGCPFTDSL